MYMSFLIASILSISFSCFGQVNKIKKIAFGDKDTCLLYETGTVKCWGANQNGVSGMLPMTEVSKPNLIKGITEADDLQLGDEFACAKMKSGALKCWGNFANMNIGSTKVYSALLDVPVASPVKQLAVGGKHLCVLLENKRLQCLGQNEFGQLGIGNRQTKMSSDWVEVKHLKVLISEKSSSRSEIHPMKEVKKLAAGKFDTCALLIDDLIFCWGMVDDDRHLEFSLRFFPEIEHRSNKSKHKAISLGSNHFCALSLIGEADCEGSWQDRKAGHKWPGGTYPSDDRFKAIYSGAHHACGVTIEGKVKCWGPNNAGEIGKLRQEGDLPLKHIRFSTEVKNIVNPEALFLGLDISCALFQDSSIKCWGSGFKLLNNSDDIHIEPYLFSSEHF